MEFVSEFGVRGNSLSGKKIQFRMVPVPRSAVCTLNLLIVAFSVLLQLNVVLFYLNVIVYKYKRKRMLLLLRRRLELCCKINLYRISALEASSGHELTDTWKRKLDTIISCCIRYVETPKKDIRLELYRIRGNRA